MQRFVRAKAKLHGMRVTGAELNHHGSITLDLEIRRRAGLDPLEFVEILNKNSGARISTYVLYGEAGSGCRILNGAAARACQIDDEVIIASSSYGDFDELAGAHPRVLKFDPQNRVAEALTYRAFRNERGEPDMSIESQGEAVPIGALVG